MADRGSSSRRGKLGDESIGQFVIGAEIGKGSFAQVYLGKHKVRSLRPCCPRPLQYHSQRSIRA